ncbi:MAG TPA: hypothetical protein VFL95_01340, partial [Gemmatimonadales bacterium]|nr:hypothetical protein [Gemmatimonadales bacterium]
MGFDPRHLSQLTVLPDLPRLVAALGHEPLWDELDPGAWIPARSVVVRRAAVVGRAGGFTWFGAEASDPALTAQRLAAAQGKRGGAAGFLVLDPEHRRLGISVSWEAAPTLVIDLDAPGRLVVTTLARIGSLPARSVTGFAVGLAEALSAEGIGRRFFSQFRLTAEQMASALVGPADPELRHGYVLLQLTRVLFLYFVQCKGWLAGDEQFLGRHVDQYLSEGRALHRRLLLPLFF